MLGNKASARVLEKAGLTLVGEYQEDRWPGSDKRALLFRTEVKR
jgi:RimJ/RimL family protein N-acetyltransferase